MKKNILNRLATITVIEWVILSIIVVSTVGVVKYFGRSSQQYKYIRLQITNKDPRYTYSDSVDLIAPNGFLKAIKSPAGQIQNEQSSAKIISIRGYDLHNNNEVAYADIRLSGYINKKTSEFIYDNQPIKIGSHITINTPDVSIPGNVIQMSDAQIENNSVQLTFHARLYSLQPWKVDGLSNLVMKEKISGNPTLTITRYTPIPPVSSILFNNPTKGSTNRFLIQDPELKDVEIEGTLTANEWSNIYYFSETTPIRVGQTLEIIDSRFGSYYAEIKSISE